MTRKKLIKDEGQVIEVEEINMPEIIEVSHTQGKKMLKKPMSEKQKANVDKLVEANRLKWELKKQEKEESIKKLSEDKIKVVVKPKRIYPVKSKKVSPKEESESETDSNHSDDKYQKKRVTKHKKYSSEEETEETEQTETETEPERLQPSKLKRYSKTKKYDDKINNKLEELEQRVKHNSFISSRVFGLKK